jgi:hypothetical protein
MMFIIAIWITSLVALRLGTGAAWGWVILLALPLVPALIDQLRNPQRWLTLGDANLRWFDGQQQTSISLADITSIRIDTRWDLSARVTLNLTDGQRLRLPVAVTPPRNEFDAALRKTPISVTRHHFRVF